MSVWIDLIGSFVFGSLLALNVMRLNADIAEQSYQSSLSYIAQGSAVTLAEVVKDDVKKAGYGVSGTAVTLADSTQVRFLADLGDDGSVDTVYYYESSTSLAASTPNPNDRVLYRVLNSSSSALRLGLTSFRVSYFDADGDSLGFPVTLANIRQLRIDMAVESTSAYDSTYAKAFVQLRIRPKNLGL